MHGCSTKPFFVSKAFPSQDSQPQIPELIRDVVLAAAAASIMLPYRSYIPMYH